MRYLKTITVPELMEALGEIKKGIDKHINKLLDSPSLYDDIKKLHFAKLFIS